MTGTGYGRPQGVGGHWAVVVIGAGQAGLAMSYLLCQRGIDHVVLERHRVGDEWRERRWDSFCLVTPNWQCRLPGFGYRGPDPDGFMPGAEVGRYLEEYAASFRPPLVEGTAVTSLRRAASGTFEIRTDHGDLTADQVVVATGPYHTAAIPRLAERLPDGVVQLHSSQYRAPERLPGGRVLVVGSGQSGCQIAEDLHLAGRRVYLSVGSAPRVARRYRGRDVVAWLSVMGYYDREIDEFPDAERIRARANHYVTGRDGGRDIDLRALARDGMRLSGRLTRVAGGTAFFAADLGHNLDQADAVSEGIKDTIDQFVAGRGLRAPTEQRYTPVWRPAREPDRLDLAAAGIEAVVWATGFHTDYRWVEVPVFDGHGYPTHRRGVTSCPGLYFLGLPWQHTWGSGRFCGVGRDAEHLAEQISMAGRRRAGDDVLWIAGTPTETYPDLEWLRGRGSAAARSRALATDGHG